MGVGGVLCLTEEVRHVGGAGVYEMWVGDVWGRIPHTHTHTPTVAAYRPTVVSTTGQALGLKCSPAWSKPLVAWCHR